ncbi:hypothetical protein BOTBODRAFT_192506 [Botryobasidium botryosum FD-172 SS1]|uniref:Uncharacterized protein n=1 Tax=Botryobasidium botryosum (strain FD-172 SS1) TaxID=930990 RepID=A0A067M619_BOTB1|nr:hypothetical protein BOTBODRAFT_192506 [Botryobasidium botryosum FD-172 SS1]
MFHHAVGMAAEFFPLSNTAPQRRPTPAVVLMVISLPPHASKSPPQCRSRRRSQITAALQRASSVGSTEERTCTTGSYNTILFDLFCPAGTCTMLHPAVRKKEVPPEMEYFIAYHFRSGEPNSPLFFLDTQPSKIKAERLYGVSALGTRLRFYCVPGDSQLSRKGIDVEHPDAPSPADLWRFDVLEEEGANKLKRVAEEVREMYGRLIGIATPGSRSPQPVALAGAVGM